MTPNIKKQIQEYDWNQTNSTKTQMIDRIQRSLRCCGAFNYTDYLDSGKGRLPLSCCGNGSMIVNTTSGLNAAESFTVRSVIMPDQNNVGGRRNRPQQPDMGRSNPEDLPSPVSVLSSTSGTSTQSSFGGSSSTRPSFPNYPNFPNSGYSGYRPEDSDSSFFSSGSASSGASSSGASSSGSSKLSSSNDNMVALSQVMTATENIPVVSEKNECLPEQAYQKGCVELMGEGNMEN